MGVVSCRLVLVGEPPEHLYLGSALLDDGGGVGAGEELFGFELGLGR